MSKLEQLINELCPNGVEYKTLEEIFYIRNGYTPSKSNSDYWENGTIPWFRMDDIRKNGRILSDSLQHISPKSVKGNLFPADSIIIATSATIGEHALLTVASLANQRFTFLTRKPKYKEQLYPKFVFYYCFILDEWCCNNTNMSGFASVDMTRFKNFEFPIPPLAIQHEIVRILDNFTELTSELIEKLTAELRARKKQYEYYRNSILENNNYPCKQLGELCKFVRGPFGGALKKECFQEGGFAVYEQQHAIYGKFEFRYYVSEDKFDELKRFEVFPNDLIMSCSGTMGKIAIIPSNAPRGIINQALLKLTANNDVDVKYLKYCFESTIAKQMNDNARGGAIKNVASVDVLKKIEVKLPPLAEQLRIVEILDRFDTLTTDISEGLPAEIEARRKQYEYYRDKLLRFKERIA